MKVDLPNYRHFEDSDKVHTLCGLTIRLLPSLSEEQVRMNSVWGDGRRTCPTCGRIFSEKEEIARTIDYLDLDQAKVVEDETHHIHSPFDIRKLFLY